ncbi:hypothetical protein HHI36_002204 [Cryptolaemus montrouzieri]|uniref:Uncharacterized protein n=1 Tax=Cryptolaemus montrouzieri TaxID=559131 RepID=A0ABD2PA99_9CUCU
MDICVLTEMKMKGRGNEEIGDYIHFYSGVRKDLRAKREVSIAIHKNLKKSIRRREEIDEQIIMLEIKKSCRNIIIVAVYADADAETKDSFYVQCFIQS